VTTKAKGTGLGLAICQRIVTDHAGSIRFESAPGRTLFRVMLPAWDKDPEAP
jgi:two-component system nitrogen regulation sensor histidine kinase GlnL